VTSPTTPRPVTPRQQAVHQWVREYIDTHGFAPTFREVADGQGCTVTSVAGHLAALRSRGLLTWGEGQARSIVITGECT
jgi:SOS-response transcriptional repressor LexA